MTAAAVGEGVFREPAAFWSTAYVDTTAEVSKVFARFSRKHFKNGQRWPITLTRVALDAVNYPFDIMHHDAFDVRGSASSSVLYQAKLRVSAPFRRNFSRSAINLSALTPRSTGSRTGDTVSDSSLDGVSYLRMDGLLRLPPKCNLEFGLTSFTKMRTAYTGLGESQISLGISDRTGRIFVHETHDFNLFRAGSRQRAVTVSGLNANTPVPDPYAGIPYPILPMYALEAGTAVPGALWPPLAAMTPRDFAQQSAEDRRTARLDSYVYGLGVFLDQIAQDDTVKASLLAGGLAAGSDYKIAKMSKLIGCRVRTQPTGDWWWRPGAPVSLVLDTITDALVYDLPEPITLGPGETLDVTLELPGSADEDTAVSKYQVGIAFNGFRSIEG
jgi:hypothetical protein